MIKIYNFEQHTDSGDTNPEWVAVRRGKFTGSDFHQYLGVTSDKGLSETAQKNLAKKVFERYGYEYETPKSKAMIAGTELEPQARSEYIFETFNNVHTVGFVERDEWVGCSPDGVIYYDAKGVIYDADGVIYDADGLIKKIIEIKCPEPAMYLRNASGYISPEYKTQMFYNMLITGAKECDFVVYYPKMKLIVQTIRWEDHEEEIKKVSDALEKILEIAKQKDEQVKKLKI